MSNCLLRCTHGLRLLRARPVPSTSLAVKAITPCKHTQSKRTYSASRSARQVGTQASSSSTPPTSPTVHDLVYILCDSRLANETSYLVQETPSSNLGDRRKYNASSVCVEENQRQEQSPSDTRAWSSSYKTKERAQSPRPMAAMDPILCAYETIRLTDKARLFNLPTSHLLNVLNRIIIHRDTSRLNFFLEDIEDLCFGGRHELAITCADALVRRASDVGFLSSDVSWRLIHSLGASNIQKLKTRVAIILATIIHECSPPPEFQDDEALALLVQQLISHMPQLDPNAGTPSVPYCVALQRIGNLLVLLGDHGCKQAVYASLTSLFRHERIPQAVLQSVDFTLSDPRVLVLNVITRSLCHWNMHTLAVDLHIRHARRLDMQESGLDLVAEVLPSGSTSSVQQVARVFIDIVTSNSPVRLSDGQLDRFYQLACERNRGDLAEQVYGHTQAANVHPPYLPPHGPVLSWLLRRMTLNSQNVHLARTLARHIVDTKERLPSQQRGDIVALLAQSGFAKEARILWETYSTGPDAIMVTGHAAAAVRLVRLFSKLAVKQTEKLDAFMEDVPESFRALLQPGAPGEMVTNAVTELATIDSERLGKARQSYAAITEIKYGQFADTVYDAFKESKEPLRYAEHRDLTTLARLAFIRQRPQDGWAALSLILDRKEIPDLYDMNVALSAMAESSPREATALLRRMRQHGMRPDGVSFATIIHYAAKADDYPLLRFLVNYSRWLDGGRLSVKAVGALLRASLKGDGLSVKGRHLNLRRSLLLLEELGKNQYVATFNLATVGARAAVNLHDTFTAFYIWKRFIMGGTDWQDHKQRKLRSHIAAQVRRYIKDSTITQEKGRVMLADLREEDQDRPGPDVDSGDR